MLFNNHLNIWLMIVLLTISRASAISYNQPRFCPNASWNRNAITFANSSIIGTEPFGIFISTNNTIYANGQSTGKIEMWTDGGANHTATISGGLSESLSIFVSETGDIYVDNGANGRVDEFPLNAGNSVPIMNVSGRCTGLFIDINNTLYCSIWDHNQVMKKSLESPASPIMIAAGTGSSGSTSDTLSQPHGIFVDINFTLYVADCLNNRIQRFQQGQLNATSVVISGTSGTISLNCPTGVAFDADGYLFIVDRGSGRIFGSGPYGFQCLVGCSGTGPASNQLINPQTLSFDIYGNIFVTDRDNDRIQKFMFATNSCEESITTVQSTYVSTSAVESTQSSTTTVPPSHLSTTSVQSTDLSTTVLSTIVTTTEQLTSITHISSQGFMRTTDGPTTLGTPSAHFVAPACSDPTRIGINCNIPNAPCDTLKPCQNNATCNNTNNTYICICLPGFNGTECQFDYRPCKPNTCWNNGTCKEFTNTTFNCTCAFGWTGIHCERKINYCENVTCLNNGVCRPLLGDYKCECLGDSFSGRHCEITKRTTVILQKVGKSFAYIAILAVTSVIGFFVIMDILKYCFGIDPVHEVREQIRRKKRVKKAKPPVIVRYTYVNAPPSSREPTLEQQISTVELTTV